MAATAEQIFDALAPLYASDPAKDIYLELAASRTSTCAFGTNYAQAVALRAAHMIELAKGTDYAGSGGAGPVTGKKEGQLSINYGAGNSEGNDSDLVMTKYGRQLQGLINGNIAAVAVTGGYDKGCC